MEILISIIVLLVAAIHAYILWFEMFAWETTGRKVFSSFPKDLFAPTKSMAANQGLYNGFLVAGLLWTFFIDDPIWKYNIALFFFTCVAVAGIYGAFTVDRKILFVQTVPAITGIVLILVSQFL